MPALCIYREIVAERRPSDVAADLGLDTVEPILEVLEALELGAQVVVSVIRPPVVHSGTLDDVDTALWRKERIDRIKVGLAWWRLLYRRWSKPRLLTWTPSAES